MNVPLPLICLLLSIVSFAVGIDPKAKHALVAYTFLVLAVVMHVAPATERLFAAAH